MTAFSEASDQRLPVAGRSRIVDAALDLIREDRGAFLGMLALNAAAVGAGLVGPWLLGRIINTVQAGGTVDAVDRLALLILISAVAQLLLARYARLVGYRFGERTLTRVRDQFVDRTLALPASVVERAGTGDLAVRGTADVAAVGTTLRDVGPNVLIAAVQALFIIVAVFLLNPLLGACGLVGLIGIWFAVRWYLRRAHTAYLAEGAANSALAEQLTLTATGARTVEALRLERNRIDMCLGTIDNCLRTRRRTLFLRSVLFPSVDVSYVVPVVGVLLIGSVLHRHGLVSLGALVASALYLRQLSQPLDTILFVVEQLQRSGASFARVEGLGTVPSPRADAGTAQPVRDPADDRIELTDVHYAYSGTNDVVRSVSLTIRPGERLAVVGPSGAGKTTLSRLLAGIDSPRTGTVAVGASRSRNSPWKPSAVRSHW